MNTVIKKIDKNIVCPEELAEAIEYLRNGEIVAFPTETVYGLGADATNASAVKKIFTAKGRPNDNPLIVHVADIESADSLAYLTPLAKKLAATFWPGPLSLVLKKRAIIPDIVSAGLDTVAVRMPDHPLILGLLKSSGLSLAAPSANISGRPSPTTAQHVFEDLNGKISMILDGGPAKIGIESTVLDISGNVPQILRPGKITEEDLTPYLDKISHDHPNTNRPSAPGMKYKHYAPKGKVRLAASLDEIKRFYEEEIKKTDKIFIIASKETACMLPSGLNINIITNQNNMDEYARNIFAAFRLADDRGAEIILVETVEEKGFGKAIMNRLKKSAAKQ